MRGKHAVPLSRSEDMNLEAGMAACGGFGPKPRFDFLDETFIVKHR